MISLPTAPATWTLSPLFENARNEADLRGWLMRAYFNPTKHARETYYRADVCKENVLEYISCSGNKFPQTPLSILGVWSVLPSLREGLKSVAGDDPVEKPAIYTKGEKTLSEIGGVIGGVTATMVNKISDGAVLKVTAMCKALSGENKWLAREAEEGIENAILNTAEVFADAVQKANTAQDALVIISGSGLVSPQDTLVADALELECLGELISQAKDGAGQAELEDIFIEDMKKTVNIFNLAQLAVSRQVYPAAKRGRPRTVVSNGQ